MKSFIRTLSFAVASIILFTTLFTGAVSSADTDYNPVTVKAENVVVETGTDTASVKIILTGIGKTGCSACHFKVHVDNDAKIIDYVLGDVAGNQVCEILNKGNTISYMWVGSSGNTVYNDTVILTAIVSVPSSAQTVNLTVEPSSDRDDFLDVEQEIGLGGVGVNGTITVVKSLKNAMRIKADSVAVSENDTETKVSVTLTNIKNFGASACRFDVEVPGAEVSDCRVRDVLGNTSYAGSNGILKFFWVGGSDNAVYSDTVVAEFNVILPDDRYIGQVFDVNIIIDPDEQFYLAADANTALGAVGINGTITVTGSNSISVEAPSIETEIGMDSFSIDITAGNITDEGLGSCKFSVEIPGATPVSITPYDLSGNISAEIVGDEANYFWVASLGGGIYEDTALAKVTFKLNEGIRSGDQLQINVSVSPDPDFYLSAKNDDLGLGAYAVNGSVSVVDHSLQHFEYTKPHNGQNGCIEHWYCPLCGKYFLDADATEEVSKQSVLLLAGDVNKDGKINSKDVIFLMKAIIGLRVCDPDFADFNGDGKVNSKDVIALMKYLTK